MKNTHQRPFGSPKVLIAVALLAMAALSTGCSPDQPSEPESSPLTRDATEPAPPDGVAPAEEPTASPTERTDGVTHSVGEVLGSPRAGMRVVLGGTIIEQLTAEDFILDDGTGAVFVDGDDDFGRLDVGDQVIVTGTVDIEDSPNRVEIQAMDVRRR